MSISEAECTDQDGNPRVLFETWVHGEGEYQCMYVDGESESKVLCKANPIFSATFSAKYFQIASSLMAQKLSSASTTETRRVRRTTLTNAKSMRTGTRGSWKSKPTARGSIRVVLFVIYGQRGNIMGSSIIAIQEEINQSVTVGVFLKFYKTVDF